MRSKNFFFIKSKMHPMCIFYNKLSISGVFELFKWVLDDPNAHEIRRPYVFHGHLDHLEPT